MIMNVLFELNYCFFLLLPYFPSFNMVRHKLKNKNNNNNLWENSGFKFSKGKNEKIMSRVASLHFCSRKLSCKHDHSHKSCIDQFMFYVNNLIEKKKRKNWIKVGHRNGNVTHRHSPRSLTFSISYLQASTHSMQVEREYLSY